MRVFGGAMVARILDGAGIARELRDEMRETVAASVAAGNRPPGLAVILVGNDPGSVVYVNAKRRDCDRVGFHSVVQHVSANVTQQDLESRVAALNLDPSIDGILVQLPLPAHIDADRIIDRIDPAKDIDGFHPYNIGRLALRRPALRSCTPKGIMQLLDRTGIEYKGAEATVIGASNHLGRPMGLELLRVGCTVTTRAQVHHRYRGQGPGSRYPHRRRRRARPGQGRLGETGGRGDRRRLHARRERQAER